MINPSSETWRVVKKHAEAGIEAARMRLETPSFGAPETEFERGRIKALREVLALVEPKIEIPSTDPHY